ncbi:hypothetical protein AAF712_003470 [Marasmius tenuissimus]|uniref:Uncharacterized protein n=1 Tax=Marasmius tenuissimus TaxID=585030 RepID=A0ABR3A7E7_9AGAR
MSLNPSKGSFRIFKLGLLTLSVALLLRLGLSAGNPDSSILKLRPQGKELHAWNLSTPPDPSDTGHLVFNTVHSLLQNWPNIRYRHGHALVPGTIPIGTLLYHGRSDPHFPNASDWTSVDPEHSYLFCRLGDECWHLTLVTTRPLNIIYFDGSSAVKIRGGSMDVQDLLLWGEARDDKAFSEGERLEMLCQEWGRPFGFDGFVRMEMDFEVMLCDMSPKGGLETVSFVKLHTERTQISRDPEEIKLRNFELIHSSSMHNEFPGETRVKLDLSRIITLYDPQLWLLNSSSSPYRGQERWDHRAANSGINVDAFRGRVKEVLQVEPSTSTQGSSLDWSALMNVIVKRYGKRLEVLRYILSSASVLEDTFTKAFTQLEVILMPYLLDDAIPDTQNTESALDLGRIYDLCSSSHTSHIVRTEAISERLTKSEQLLLASIRTTSKEICRVLVNAWGIGFLARSTGSNSKSANHTSIQGIVTTWQADITRLMEWLDWSMWVKCKPACGDEELCYLPTWPFFGGPPPADTYIPDHMKQTEEEEQAWRKPTPRCIRRLSPYEF